MARLAPVSAQNSGNGHKGLGGSELSQNYYLIIVTELWPGDLPGWSPSLVSSFFSREGPFTRGISRSAEPGG